MKVSEFNELLGEVIAAINVDYILLVYQNDLTGEPEMEVNLSEWYEYLIEEKKKEFGKD